MASRSVPVSPVAAFCLVAALVLALVAVLPVLVLDPEQEGKSVEHSKTG